MIAAQELPGEIAIVSRVVIALSDTLNGVVGLLMKRMFIACLMLQTMAAVANSDGSLPFELVRWSVTDESVAVKTSSGIQIIQKGSSESGSGLRLVQVSRNLIIFSSSNKNGERLKISISEMGSLSYQRVSILPDHNL